MPHNHLTAYSKKCEVGKHLGNKSYAITTKTPAGDDGRKPWAVVVRIKEHALYTFYLIKERKFCL